MIIAIFFIIGKIILGISTLIGLIFLGLLFIDIIEDLIDFVVRTFTKGKPIAPCYCSDCIFFPTCDKTTSPRGFCNEGKNIEKYLK